MAIEHALIVLTWHENLPNEEVPPEHLWEDSAGLEQWWAWVEQKRKDDSPDAKPPARLGGSSESSDDTEGDGDQSPGMAENDLARFLKQG